MKGFKQDKSLEILHTHLLEVGGPNLSCKCQESMEE